MISNPFVQKNDDGTISVLPAFVIAGFLTAIVFASIWIVAAALDGHWIFGWNALSDLGVAKNMVSRILFNYGCAITAACGCVFGYGLIRYERGWLYLSGALVLIGCIFLMGVGTIPESYGTPHLTCAGIFGGFACVAMFCSGLGDFKAGRRIYAFIDFFLLFLCVVAELVGQALNFDFGFFEAWSIINILAWVVTQSVKYSRLLGMITYEDPVRKVFDENWKIH